MALNASQLAKMLNAYTIDPGPPKVIAIPGASGLAALQDLTVTGALLRKQVVTLDPRTNERSMRLGANGGAYAISPGDGDLHFCLGDQQIKPHVVCELQNGTAWLSGFNQAVGSRITVAGFFRCLFEHPGFSGYDDAHIFEIHPVQAVAMGGGILSFNVDIPEQKAIHTWKQPYNLNDQDGRVKVNYERAGDVLTFMGMDGTDENYVRVGGRVSSIHLNASGGPPASFTLNSPDIGHPLEVHCLHGTAAARQLRQLKGNAISMIGLRNIDMAHALQGRYTINLLAIDLQVEPTTGMRKKQSLVGHHT